MFQEIVKRRASQNDRTHGSFADREALLHPERRRLHHGDRVLPRRCHVAVRSVGAERDVRALPLDLHAFGQAPVLRVAYGDPVVGEVGDKGVTAVG